MAETDTLRVPFDTLCSEFHRVLLRNGFSTERAEICARIFAENSRDGVYSHGLNILPWFVNAIERGVVKPDAEPAKVSHRGTFEQWDGNLAPGPVSARLCMGRAIELAREYTIGCVALRNTSHWSRAGAYGLQATEAGCIGICWANTVPMMPPWGSDEAKIGNNPLVVAVPRDDGPILLDMALSQFSGGRLRIHMKSGDPLPFPGGYDEAGQLSHDATAIRKTKRLLPIGLWKGSGLALVLDLIAAVLSGGRGTFEAWHNEGEGGVSQLFIAIDAAAAVGENIVRDTVDRIIADFQTAKPIDENTHVTYPGQRMLETRKENMELGIPVDPDIWRQVQAT